MQNDKYGFISEMEAKTNEELIGCFNSLVGKTAWGNARAHYGSALREEILKRNMDSSAIITESAMILRHKVWLDGNIIRIVNDEK